MSEMGGGSEIEERKGGREKDRGERRGKKKIPVYLFQCGPNRDGQRIERERLFMCASIPVQTRRSERGREREKERERENVTAGKLRQSIRSPGPKELVLGFVELLRYFLPGTTRLAFNN